MVMAPIEAKGGDGETKSNGATSGGGGSGGVVLLRAGGVLAVGNTTAGVIATGGAAGGADAGKGSVGRVRIDARSRDASVTSTPAIGYRGPMFGMTTPVIVTAPKPQLTIVGQPSASIKYVIESEDGKTTAQTEFTIPSTGEGVLPLAASLFEGHNRICLLVTGSSTRRDEAENCIALAYIRTE